MTTPAAVLPAMGERESVPCNLCGATEGFYREGFYDRYGFDQKCSRCLNCSLVFLNPRMTKGAYAEFYRTTYRPLVSAFHGWEINAQTIQVEQRVYAQALEHFLRASKAFQWRNGSHLRGVRTILDVGGSTGVVARHMARLFVAKATVLDPAPEELAQAKDLEVLPGFVEDYAFPAGAYDLALLCQTVDHLLDINGTLRKLHNCSRFLFVDIVDYDRTREIKVDHPFNLTRETMEAFLSMTSWQIRHRADTANDHVAYLCEAA